MQLGDPFRVPCALAFVAIAALANGGCVLGDGGKGGDGPAATGGSGGSSAQSCADASECATGFCVDGFCCDTDCQEPCRACAATLKGTGPNGECGPILAGSDPQNECAVGSSESCKSSPDGACDGAGACSTWPVGTECAPAHCAGSTVVLAYTCDAAGSCVPDAPISCAPYLCSMGECKGSCSDDSGCVAGAACINDACVPTKPLGAPCSLHEECLSNQCADGVCCSTLCDGPCESCVLPGSVGTCSSVPADASDPPLCPAPNTCGANGDCPGFLPVGEPCDSFGPGAKPPECKGLYCADHVCCKTACAVPCRRCNSGTCVPVYNGVDSWPPQSFNGCQEVNACPHACDECGPDATCVSPP